MLVELGFNSIPVEFIFLFCSFLFIKEEDVGGIRFEFDSGFSFYVRSCSYKTKVFFDFCFWFYFLFVLVEKGKRKDVNRIRFEFLNHL